MLQVQDVQPSYDCAIGVVQSVAPQHLTVVIHGHWQDLSLKNYHELDVIRRVVTELQDVLNQQHHHVGYFQQFLVLDFRLNLQS